MKLKPEAELAEDFGLPVEKVAELRRRHKWPHVRLTRFDVRYTPEQIAAIVALESVKPKAVKAPSPAGQTGRSGRRAS
jgi:hypothetical protein